MPLERIPLTQPIESRKADFKKDSRSVNCVFETRDQKRELVKRPGLVKAVQVTPATYPTIKDGQGLFEFNNLIIAVIDDVVYSIDPITYAVTTKGTMVGTLQNVYAVKSYLNGYLFLHNGTNGYLLSKAGTFSGFSNDKVVTVDVTNGGVNYSVGTTVSFSAPPSGTTATGTVTFAGENGGSVTEITITNQGSGYVTAPTISFNKPTTRTPTATGNVNEYTIVVSSATGLYQGMYVTGTGVAPNAFITNIAGTTVTLNLSNVSAVSGTMTIADNGSNASATAVLNAFPSGPFVPGAVFLDQYIFVAGENNKIYNSNVDDPTSWDPLSYISFEQNTDDLVGISKHLNYLVAFGQWSTQFFYDAANINGSPLAIAPSYSNEVGCANGATICQTEQTVFWVGTSRVRGRSVYMLDGTSPVRVSTTNIDRFLEVSTLEEATAYTYKFNGHLLYILTMHDINVTIVYDAIEKIWYQWTMYAQASADQPNPGTFYESYFRPTYYADVNDTAYVLDDDTAVLYYFDDYTYTDAGAPIYCRSVTDLVDNGTTNRKFYGRLEVVGDKVGATMKVRHTGNDYQTWSAYRSVDLSQPRSQMYQCGADRRRAWEFLCTDAVPLRLDAVEIDFEVGGLDPAQGVGGGTRYRR